jgi:hypothetical protein
MKPNKNQDSWFSVKLIFNFQIDGIPDSKDKNYSDEFNMYEEILILVKAESFELAYEAAEAYARNMEDDHVNPYGQTVHYKFVEAIDCFNIMSATLVSGTEVYSRFLRTPKDIDKKTFLDRFYPETINASSEKDFNYILRYKEFNED